MLQVVTTGAYYPLVVFTTWKIFTTGASYLTTGTLCSALLNRSGTTGVRILNWSNLRFRALQNR